MLSQSIVTAADLQTAKDLTIESRAEVAATKPSVLRAWIRSKGFVCRNDVREAELVNRADSIRIWLEDPQIFNRPPKARYATGEPQYRIGNIGRLYKSRYRIANNGLEAVQSQADLSRLSKEDLQAFVRSRVAGGCSRKNISDLLSLAQKALD